MMKLADLLREIQLNEYSDKLINSMVALYKPQTQDSEDQIKQHIKRFEQLAGALASKVQQQNPIVLRILPPELLQHNKFRDITQYKEYETLTKILKSLDNKQVDPYKQAIENLKKSDQYMNPTIIGNYVARFKQNVGRLEALVKEKNPDAIASIPKELLAKDAYKNILNWRKFSELEKMLDHLFQQTSDEKAEVNSAETDADQVYENKETGIEIYQGDAEHKCVKYGSNQYYGWCISRTTGSMYGNYRFMQSEGKNRMFYFVFDKTQSDKKDGGKFVNPYHVVVIHVNEKGLYTRTDATNGGDEPYGGCKWSELGSYFKGTQGQALWNKIKNLEKYFTFRAPSAEERRAQGLKGQKMTLDQFIELPQEDQLSWLRINAADNKLVTSEIVKSLPAFGEPSTNDLINHNRLFTFEELKNNKGLLKRYADYRYTRFPKTVLPYKFIPYLKEELQYKYFEEFEDKFLTPEVIEAYFNPSILKKYLTDKINAYGYLPKSMVKHLDAKQRQIYDIYSLSFSDSQYSATYDEDNIGELPQQSVNIFPVSQKTYQAFTPIQKQNFLDLLKKYGSDKENLNKIPAIIVGFPITFYVNNNWYFITPQSMGNEENGILMDQNGTTLLQGIDMNNVEVMKGKDIQRGFGDWYIPLPQNSNAIYFTDNDFDYVDLGGDKKITKEQFKSGKFKVNEELKFRFQRLGGIIK